MKRAFSVHTKAIAGILMVLAAELVILKPDIFTWLRGHPVFDVFIGALVALFHLYNTYEREHFQG